MLAVTLGSALGLALLMQGAGKGLARGSHYAGRSAAGDSGASSHCPLSYNLPSKLVS
jgi:hypothetical protein